MYLRTLGAIAALLVAGTGPAQLRVAAPLVPQVDHHQHLLSPTLARRLLEVPAAIELPPELHRRFREGLPRFNDAAALAELYTEDAVLIFSFAPQGPAPENWVRGRQRIANFLAGAFRNQYSLTPISYSIDGSAGYIAGYFRGIPRHYAVLLSLRKGGDGAWRIAAQSMTFGGPAPAGPVTADRLIAQLDAAGIQRAAVLSLAYAHGSPSLRGNDEYAQVRAENDWTGQQVAQYPTRLRALCSVNPLREYALTELDRCAKDPNLRHGLKLHFANSQVDLQNAGHVEQVRQVFRAANSRRMPIVVHVWTGDQRIGKPYGRAEAQLFLKDVLPVAPDIPIQIAHLAGAGPGLDPGSKEALAVFADAVSAADPRTRNLYFDVTTNVTVQTSAEEAAFIAASLRQIGLQRILYGSDLAIGGNPTARQSWAAFRGMLPLTEAEFRTIADNVAPYMR
jgi:predicted TIM-barrel fold metal-dependent hydrolase